LSSALCKKGICGSSYAAGLRAVQVGKTVCGSRAVGERRAAACPVGAGFCPMGQIPPKCALFRILAKEKLRKVP